MKALHVILGLLLYIVLLLGSAGCAYIAWYQPDLWDHTLDLIRQERLLSMGGASAFFALVLVFLVTGIKRTTKVDYLTFDNESGTISISISAINEFMSKLGNEYAAVMSLRPHVKTVGGGLDIALDVRVRAGSQIPELCRMLQDSVREKLSKNLGVVDIHGIRVMVKEIIPVADSEKRDEG